ncbi:hypothetical protein [Dankookia sp. P2]|uniref:hypothetical protein n=1 Tax=Dankookia sp. P2 TaxID=3423955 RepID=UPI003D665EA1
MTVGAEQRQLVGREGARQHMRDVDDPDAFERTHGGYSLDVLAGSMPTLAAHANRLHHTRHGGNDQP